MLDDVRYCAWSKCGKRLVKKEDETNQQWNRRTCCDKRCAGHHREEVKRVQKQHAGKGSATERPKTKPVVAVEPTRQQQRLDRDECLRQRMMRGALR